MQIKIDKNKKRNEKGKQKRHIQNKEKRKAPPRYPQAGKGVRRCAMREFKSRTKKKVNGERRTKTKTLKLYSKRQFNSLNYIFSFVLYAHFSLVLVSLEYVALCKVILRIFHLARSFVLIRFRFHPVILAVDSCKLISMFIPCIFVPCCATNDWLPVPASVKCNNEKKEY